MIVNDFMIYLQNQLTESGLTESTANLYIKNLFKINENKPYKSLAFLKKTENIMKLIEHYAVSTQINIIASILGVYKLFKDEKKYDKSKNSYMDIINKLKNNEKIENPDNTKSQSQKDNWVSWEEIETIKKNLKEKIEGYGKKNITPSQYENIIKYFLICLYTDIPPRRNKDYQECFIVKEYLESMPDNNNYLCLKTNRFIFNNYKTSKKYGQQITDFNSNDNLKEAFSYYIQHHPLMKVKLGKNTMVRLLVKHSGSPYSQINDITRLLNKLFGKKKIGASMLRHIYLTNKFGDSFEEKKEIAKEMGHSVSQQQDYILIKE